MITTEQEAREKWCPQARVTAYLNSTAPESPPVLLIGNGSNKILVDEPATQASVSAALDASKACLCMASGCMAWSWYDTAERGQGRRGFCGFTNSGRD